MRSLKVMFVAMLLLMPSVVAAQSSEQLPPEGKLYPLSELGFSPADKEACGPYFRFTGVPKDKTKVGTLTFVYGYYDKSKNTDVRGIPLMGTDKVEVRVVKGTTTPTVQHVRQGGPVYPWFVITLSPQDFTKAPCLVHTMVGRKPPTTRT